MMPPQGALMRVFVLLVYIAAAIAVALDIHASAWAVLHLTGAAAGVCAISMAISYAGAVGALASGPVEDQGAEYMERMELEGWDD